MPNKSVQDALMKSRGLTFNQMYHQNTVDQNKQMTNPDGSVTTANVIGLPFQGKEYNLPSYNRDLGRSMSPQETMNYWMPKILSGEIQGYDSIEEAEIAAQKEHGMMDDWAKSR